MIDKIKGLDEAQERQVIVASAECLIDRLPVFNMDMEQNSVDHVCRMIGHAAEGAYVRTYTVQSFANLWTGHACRETRELLSITVHGGESMHC